MVKDPVTGKYPSVEFEEGEEGGNATWKGLRVIPLIKTSGLWFAGKSYGMSFQVVQMMIFFRSEFVGCAIETDETEEVDVDQPLIDTDEPSKKKQKTSDSETSSSAPGFNTPKSVEVGA